MKLQLIVLLLGILTLSHAQAGQVSDLLTRLQSEAQKKVPGAACFEAMIPVYWAQSDVPLDNVLGSFSDPNSDTTYLRVQFVTSSTGDEFYPSNDTYEAPPMRGGAYPRGGYPPWKALPESADLHPAITGLKIDRPELQKIYKELLAQWDHGFIMGGSINITTVGRIRGLTQDYYNSNGIFRSLRDSHVLVIFKENNTPPSSAYVQVFDKFAIYDGETGQALSQGQMEVHRPRPSPPGAVSSGGH